jgi:hypothetical protein
VQKTSTTRLATLVETNLPSGSVAEREHPGLEEDPRWLLARRIASSKGFAKSRFLTSFILYICEKHLLQLTDEITEQQIGEHVFRRPRGYNPGEDNIVRNYARLLRQRLEEYFSGEGIDEPIRIVVPRGKYVPVFIEENTLVESSRLAEIVPQTPKPPTAEAPAPTLIQPVPIVRSSWALRALCAALFLALIVVSLIRTGTKHPTGAADRFWSGFFSPTRDTLLVPADSGLAIYQDLTKKRISLAEYASREYEKHTLSPLGVDPAIVNELGSRRYTSVVDLHLVSTISQLPAVVKDRLKVRYAREITLDDLKQSNVILLGSFHANPWVELFQKDMNFRFEPQKKKRPTTSSFITCIR